MPRPTTEKIRMTSTFGHREPELAAIKILDTQWERPFEPVDPKIFTDTEEREGFDDLRAMGWIGENNVPTRAFWNRVHGR